MKTTLILAGLSALLLVACNKQSTPPASTPAPKVSPATPSVSSGMSSDDKTKAMDAAKASAKAAGGGKE